MMGPHAHCVDMAQKYTFYRKELEAHGHTIEGRDIPMAQLIAVAGTDREAEDIARQGAQWMIGSYMNPTKLANVSTSVMLRSAETGDSKAINPIDHYLDGVVIYGTPERVFDEIQRRRESMFLDYMLCAPLSHTSFMMFTEKVLPRLL